VGCEEKNGQELILLLLEGFYMRLAFSFVVLLVIVGSACSRPHTFQKTEPIMGTDVSITVVAPSAAEGEAAIDAGLAEVHRLDEMMSLYKDQSEVSRVNAAAGKQPVRVSPDMIEIVEAAKRTSELSNGVFDITIGPLVVLWQMRLKENSVPTDAEIARIKPLVNYRNLVVDKNASTLFLKRQGMIIDLGGMKGFIADKVAAVLKARGVRNALIALAGDIWALGRRENNEPWSVGVQHPREHDKILMTLDLTDKYISTSGDYERFVIREKKRYHHIIDPRTGKPSRGVISATLIGQNGAFTDSLAKAPFILGPEQGLAIVRKAGIEAIIVDESGTVYETEGVKALTGRSPSK
jgi:thiamine biosynthesis lipoprotein